MSDALASRVAWQTSGDHTHSDLRGNPGRIELAKEFLQNARTLLGWNMSSLALKRDISLNGTAREKSFQINGLENQTCDATIPKGGYSPIHYPTTDGITKS